MRTTNFIMLMLAAIVFCGCQDDGYLIDGGIHKAKVNMTTYDYLTTNPAFDTLVALIDKAGLKETINGDVTFFAPTDFSIVNYVKAKRGDMLGLDPFSNFTLEDIPVETLRDTLKQYIVPGSLNRNNMTEDGEIVTTLMGNQVHVALVPVNDLYTNYVSTWPEYVFFAKIMGAGLDDPDNLPADEDIDIRNVCQTSGIETTTGTLHVLENQHVMFYFVQTHFPG